MWISHRRAKFLLIGFTSILALNSGEAHADTSVKPSWGSAQDALSRQYQSGASASWQPPAPLRARLTAIAFKTQPERQSPKAKTIAWQSADEAATARLGRMSAYGNTATPVRPQQSIYTNRQTAQNIAPPSAAPTTTVPLPVVPPSAVRAPVTQANLPVATPQGRLNPTGRQISLVGPIREGQAIVGEISFTLTADDKLLVDANGLTEALAPIITPDALSQFKAFVADKNTVESEALATIGYIVSYDPRTISLTLVLPASARPTRTLQLSNFDRERVGDYTPPARLSAYLNARSSVDYQWTGADQGLGDLNVSFDGAIRFNNIVFETDGTYAGGSDEPFRRDSSRFVFDQVELQRRWTFGDLQPAGRGFVGASPMAGIGVIKSYSLLEPQRNVQPRGEREFIIDRASTVEAFVNGRSVRRIRLDPGSYKVRDFPFGQGLNDVKLVIEDDFGRKENIEFSIFFDRSLLSEGLSEYGASLGILAAGGINGRSYESSEPVFSGFYRRGVRAGLTLGASTHVRSDGFALGGEGTWSSRLGTLGADVGFSSLDAVGEGYALNLTFQRLFRSESSQGRALSLSLQARSENFAVPGSLSADNPFAYQGGIAFSQSLGESQFVSVDLRYSVGRGIEPDGYSSKISYGYRLSNNANLTAEAFSEESRGIENTGFRLGLVFRFGTNDSVTADYDSNGSQARLGYRRSGGSGVGAWNASLDVNNGEAGTGANAGLSLTGNRVDLALTHATSFDGPSGATSSQRSSLRFASAIAYADGAIGLSRPIFDSFALVTPHKSLENRQVLISPRDDDYSAASGIFGAAVASDLSSYSERTVTFNVPDAPAGYDLGAGNARVYPPYRSGYRVEVGSEYTMTAIGRLLDQDSQPLALIAGAAVEVSAPTRTPISVFTNRDGRFGLVGVRPGKWVVTMPSTPPLKFEITIPETDTSIVRLADIRGEPAQ
jgi:outer membrane usher protein